MRLEELKNEMPKTPDFIHSMIQEEVNKQMKETKIVSIRNKDKKWNMSRVAVASVACLIATSTIAYAGTKLYSMQIEKSGKYSVETGIKAENDKKIIKVPEKVYDISIAAGYMPGDQIIGVGDEELRSGELIRAELAEYKGQEVNVTVARIQADSLGHESSQHVVIPTAVNDEGMIGLELQPVEDVCLTRVEYGFFESIPAGIKMAGNEIASYWEQLKMIVNPDTKLYKEVGGFLSIGGVFPDTWDWQSFWRITALISIMLAVMNLLPIPGLDGGHALFTLWEIITRRKPSDKFMEIMQWIGLALLLMLLVYANGNDIIKLFS